MNKKIVLKKHVICIFVLNIVTFLLLILFKTIYGKLNYWIVIQNIMLFINLVALFVGIAFNVLYITHDKKFDTKNSFIIPIIVFCVLQVFNIGIVNIVNSTHDSAYADLTAKLSSYCDADNYYCDSYEIMRYSKNNDFVAYKTYYDYNNQKNDIEIHVKYSADSIISVEATIYSRKSSFSNYLIKNNIKKYFYNYNYEVDEDKIAAAFDKRFEGVVTDNNDTSNITYKVKEIYDKNKRLDRIATIITLKNK